MFHLDADWTFGAGQAAAGARLAYKKVSIIPRRHIVSKMNEETWVEAGHTTPAENMGRITSGLLSTQHYAADFLPWGWTPFGKRRGASTF